MGKFACTCGHVISDVQCPNEVTGWLLSDKSGESFFNSISETIDDYLRHVANDNLRGWRAKYFNEMYPHDASAGEMIHDVLTNRFFYLTLGTFECDKCGRLWFQQTPDMNHYHGYSPDDDPDARTKMLGYNQGVEESTDAKNGRTKP